MNIERLTKQIDMTGNALVWVGLIIVLSIIIL